ncbi:MAG: T9SS type A sorting domain-containing protein, partial [Bacteroidetes bacterium]|nr:T9SS type A sorting domain-containing protein [Bacteroidota bacterium]
IAEIGQLPIRVFPNPAHADLFVESPDGQPVDVQVHDLTGKLEMQQRRVRQVGVSALAPGLYVLTINGKPGMPEMHIRFVKE